MKVPACCGFEMEHYTEAADDQVREIWKCLRCQSTLPLYYWPWTWFWLVVKRRDLDYVIEPSWWLGAVSSFERRFTSDELTFTVMPLNVLIDWVVRLYRWARYRRPDAATQLLEDTYRRGRLEGKHRAETVMRDKLKRAGITFVDVNAEEPGEP